jgi:UPF0755 protein
MSKWKLLSLATMMFGAGAGVFIYRYLNQPVEPNRTERIAVLIEKGARPSEVAKQLADAGIIHHPKLFVYAGRILRVWGRLKFAEYDMSPSMTPLQVYRVLESGIGAHRELLVREGDNVYQIAEIMESAGLGPKDEILQLLKSRELIDLMGLGREGMTSFEGYLLPNTYYFEKKDLAVTIIRRMVDAFLKTWTPALNARAQELGMTRYQVVTLASMIEKETGASHERPVISSVFHNRLKKRMRLQSDPTTIYGMWERYNGNIRKQDLRTPSPYNTYTVPALPEGPISNPHPLAVKAALYPDETEFLYFVSKNDGTHMFSKTYEEHDGWVQTLQRDRRAREGKSWRDLKQGSDGLIKTN